MSQLGNKIFRVYSSRVLAQPLYAAESFLVPVHTPTPVFPLEPIKTRYAGKVRAQLWIKSDGQVQQFLTLDERQALVLELLEATPGIVAQCPKNPMRR